MNNVVDIEIYKFPCVILTDVHTKISNVQQLLNIYSDHQFICLGDITDLFNYNKDKANQNSIEFFSELKIPCLLGNHEQQLLSCETGNHLLTTKFDEASLLNINVDYGLTQQHLDFLRSLPRGFKLTLPNNKHYLCYHNRPQCLWSFTEPPIPKELFIENYKFDSDTIGILIGHSHKNFTVDFTDISCKLHGIGALKFGDYALLTEAGIEYKKL